MAENMKLVQQMDKDAAKTDADFCIFLPNMETGKRRKYKGFCQKFSILFLQKNVDKAFDGQKQTKNILDIWKNHKS